MQEWHVYNILTWLLEPDSGTEICVQKVYWACPRDQHLCRSKGSETGSREELNGFPGGSCLVTKLCLTLDPMDYSQPGSSAPGIPRARILEWVAISFSRGSSQPRN